MASCGGSHPLLYVGNVIFTKSYPMHSNYQVGLVTNGWHFSAIETSVGVIEWDSGRNPGLDVWDGGTLHRPHGRDSLRDGSLRGYINGNCPPLNA